MTIKPFAIQGGDLTLGGVSLQAGASGVVIPGVTQATSYTVEEVNDTGDQTYSNFPLDTEGEVVVIDAALYDTIVAQGDERHFADYTVTTDGEGYIDEIQVNGQGAYTGILTGQAQSFDMYAYIGAGSASDRPLVPQDWIQIPFRPKMRAGEIETIGSGGSSLTVGDGVGTSVENVTEILINGTITEIEPGIVGITINGGTTGDANIWIQDFETTTGAPADVAGMASSVEYLANGDIIALFVHYVDFNGQNANRYSSVARFTPTGEKLWSMAFQGSQYTDGWGMAVDNDGGFIYVAGRSDNTGPYEIATLTKLAQADGAIVWSKTYDVGYDNTNAVVDVATDGNPVVVGYADNGTDTQIVTSKISSVDGSIIWSKALNGQGYDEAYGMAVGPSGEVVTVGYMDQVGIIDAAATLYTEPASNPNWTSGVGGPVDGVNFSVTFTDGVPTFTNVSDTLGNRTVDGVLGVIGGNAFGGANPADNMTVKVGTLVPNDTNNRILVAKYAANGTIAWQKAVTVDAGFDCNGADADIDGDGNIYVCGNFSTDSQSPWLTAMIIIKFNSSGVKQWTRKVQGDCQDYAASIVVGPDNCLYLSAVTASNGNEDYSMVVAKYTIDGLVAWQRLLDNTTTWTFAGGGFFGPGGSGSTIAVRTGYVAVVGGFADPGNTIPHAILAQFDSAGTVFPAGDYDFKAASFSGLLDGSASNITVFDADKTASDYSNAFDVFDFDPDYDLTSDLVGTLYSGSSATSTFNGSTAALTLTGNIPYVNNVLSTVVDFTRPNNSTTTVDAIDTGLTIKRGSGGAIYNSADNVETSWNENQSPLGTEWNSDGWGDLTDVEARTYTTFYEAAGGNNNIGSVLVHKEFVMHDTINDKYYKINFHFWQPNNGGGSNQSLDERSGFSYTRTLLDLTGSVYFVHPAGSAEENVDDIDTGLSITRGTGGGGIYNAAEDSEWDPDFTPYGTLWNDDGWNDFTDITARLWKPLYSAVHGQLGNHLVGRELLMHDTINNKYYTVKFTEWGQDNGGSFSYIRREINRTGTKLGITFADGTQQITAGLTVNRDGNVELPGGLTLPTKSNTGYYYNSTLNGPTLQLSNDSTNEVVVTGPPATANDSYAQRIVIQGQRGYGRWGQNIAGEGGDIYLWGGTGGESDSGSGGSGGDIKVRGGQGQDNEGGYVKIEAGDASHYGNTYYGNGGYVQISAGDVTDSGGNSNNRGGDVTITAGKARTDSTKSGAINLYTGGNGNDGTQKYWSFRNDGVLQLPVGADIVASDGTTSVLGGSGGGFATTSTLVNGSYSVSLSSSTGILTLSTASTILGAGTDPNVYIETSTTATTSIWTFGTNGELTLPAATPVIKGGGTGTDVTIVATTGTNTSTWVFAADGGLTVPGSIIPNTNVAYDLGSPTAKFRSLYLSTSTIYIGTSTISISEAGQMLVNGNDAVSKLEYFGGEGNGPRDAGSIDWTTSTITFNIPGKELLTAIYDLKPGNKIRAANTLGFDQEFTIAGNAREYIRNPGGYQMAEIAVAETTSTTRYAFSLYLPVKDKSATLSNGTWTVAVSTTGTVVFPNGTQQTSASISIADLKTLVAASTDFADFKSRIAGL